MKKNLNYIRALDLKGVRGESKQCQICKVKFSFSNKEHQCKRCKRAVCEGCSKNKLVILKYSVKPQVPHRACNPCKEEYDEMKKFVDDNKIQFDHDSVSLEWLHGLNMQIDEARVSYKQGNCLDKTELNTFKQQLQQVYDEIEKEMNYSLRDFIAMTTSKVDRQNIVNTIDRVLTCFLTNHPEVGYHADLIFLTLFMLCFSSEACAYALLQALYIDLYPNNYYYTQLRLQKQEFEKEAVQICKLLNAIKVPTDQLKPFLQMLKHYILSLSLNLLNFESTYFIISQIFSEDGYNEIVKTLAAVFSSIDTSSTIDQMMVQILWTTRRSTLQDVYYRVKKFKLESEQVTRTMSVINQREQEFRQQSDQMRKDISDLQKQLQASKINTEQLQEQLRKAKTLQEKAEQQVLEANMISQKFQAENQSLLETNQGLKLELIKRSNVMTESQANSQLETTSKTFETEELEQQLSTANNLIHQLQKENTNLESLVTKLNQELELAKMQANQPSQMSQLIQLKNQTINKQQAELNAKQDQIGQLQMELSNIRKQGNEMTRSTSVANISSVIKDLEDGKNLIDKKNQEIIKLKRQLSEAQAMVTSNVHRESNISSQGQTMAPQTDIEVSEELQLFLTDVDPQKRVAARKLKQIMASMQEELIFQRTQAEIKRDQLDPYKKRAESLQKQFDYLVEQNKELQCCVEQKRDQIQELTKKKQLQIQPKMILSDKEVTMDTHQGCAPQGKDCSIF